jgi:hypothetical protein
VVARFGRARDVSLYSLLALGVGVVAFGGRVVAGGRSTDDWAFAARWHQLRSFSDMLALLDGELPF